MSGVHGFIYAAVYQPVLSVSSYLSPSVSGVLSAPVISCSPSFVMHHHCRLDSSAVSLSTVVI